MEAGDTRLQGAAGDAVAPAFSLEGYAVEEVIGRGGTGTVYRAIQRSHNRPVAIKVLGESCRNDPDSIGRFRTEAELLATLEHPHIVPMLDSGTADGLPYIVMRLIEGPNLRQVIRLGPLDLPDALAVLADVAEALDFAHGKGVLHRDVKPHNMLLDHGGHVWLADFGFSRPIVPIGPRRPGRRLAGTIDYLAPELLAGGSASPASDEYALAVSAFQLLTGELPFPAESGSGALLAHRTLPRRAASQINDALPLAVDSVLSDAMAMDPAARPATATAFVDRLARSLDLSSQRRTPHGLPTVASQLATPDPPVAELTAADTVSEVTPRRRRGWVAKAALMILAAASAIAGLLAWLPGGHASAPHTHAETALTSARTWFDYTRAGGRAGETIASGVTVQVSCRLRGESVANGDPWWYRIASAPWNEQMYGPAANFASAADGTPAAADRPAYDSAVPVCTYFAEIPGNHDGTHTWSDYTDGGGAYGKPLPGFTPARVLCRTRGLKVQDGNTWWYRIGGAPWDGHFYASADAFYNNGEHAGSLHGTAFVDLHVPLCNSGG